MPNSENAPRVIVRPMINTDAEAIHGIHTACLRKTLSSHYSSEQLEAWLEGRTPEGYLRGAENGEIYLVAERGQAVVGYANWQDQELLSLFVLPEFQNQGVGALLLKACDANADIRWVKATLGATGFYSRFGFLRVRRGQMEKRGVQIPHILMARDEMLDGG
jgi:predicted N-acetyltransferase YhbS